MGHVQLRQEKDYQTKEVEGVTFKAYPPESWPDFWDWWWELDVYKAILSRTEPGTVFLDVGAWIGPHSIPAALKGATVHAYEPDPLAYDQLQDNVSLNSTESRLPIICYPFAVHGSQNGIDPKEIGITPIGNSETRCDQGGDEIITSIPFIHVLEAHKPDIVKIDVEGMEGELILDLAAYKPKTIILSHHSRMFPERKILQKILSILGPFYDIVTVKGEPITDQMHNEIGELLLNGR